MRDSRSCPATFLALHVSARRAIRRAADLLGGLHAPHVRSALKAADRADRAGHGVLEGERRRLLNAQALGGAQAEDLGNLETARAARKAELEDEAVLLDHADRKCGCDAEAALFLEAQKLVGELAAHHDVVHVAGCLDADARGEHLVAFVAVCGLSYTARSSRGQA